MKYINLPSRITGNASNTQHSSGVAQVKRCRALHPTRRQMSYPKTWRIWYSKLGIHDTQAERQAKISSKTTYRKRVFVIFERVLVHCFCLTLNISNQSEFRCVFRDVCHIKFSTMFLYQKRNGDVIGHIWAGGIFNFWKGGVVEHFLKGELWFKKRLIILLEKIWKKWAFWCVRSFLRTHIQYFKLFFHFSIILF